MKKIIAVLVIVIINSISAYAFNGEGYVNVRTAKIRRDATKKSKVVDYLSVDKHITILEKKRQWYRIKYEKDGKERKGWISASLIRLIEKSRINVEFLNINEKFQKYFTDNLLFLDSQLKGYDLSKLKLVILYSRESNTSRMTLILPFDKTYYDKKKTKEMSGSFIDFMVYNDYLWGLVKYKVHVAESIERETMDDFQALMSFNANLLLIKDNGDSVILSGKFSGDYVVFNPYIDVELADYNPFRIFTHDKESVVEQSVFYLPKAKSSDGKFLSATLLYNFFDIELY
jgi:hypothetical protein